MVNLTLYPHQEKCKNLILTKPYVGLFMDCGTGKTLASLKALEELGLEKHVLIIAPKIALISTWAAEIKKWGFSFNVYSLSTKLNGTSLTKKKRHERYEAVTKIKTPSIFLISSSLIKDLIEYYTPKKFPFDTVIIDEIHEFKDASTNRAKAFSRVRPYLSRVIGLTGTPTPNKLEDLFGVMKMIDDGKRLGKYITHFRETYLTPNLYVTGPNGRPVLWDPKPGAEEEIYKKIEDITVSVKNTVLKLPEKNIINYYGELDDKELKLYKEAIKKMVIELEQFTSDAEKEDFIIKSKADLANKLRQIAQGHLYEPQETWENPNTPVYTIIHTKKFDLLKQIIDTTEDNIILVYHYRSDLIELEKFLKETMKFNKKGAPTYKVYDKKDETKNAWNQGKIKILLIQPKSASVSLNLQEGGHTMVWFGLTYSSNDYIQTCARIYRSGQKHQVNIFHLMIRNTIDERILQIIHSKTAKQDQLLNAIKLELQKYLKK